MVVLVKRSMIFKDFTNILLDFDKISFQSKHFLDMISAYSQLFQTELTIKEVKTCQ